MLDNDSKFELEQYLKEHQTLDIIHFVLPGAVVSGQLITSATDEYGEDKHPKTIGIQNADIYTGLRIVTMDNLFIPVNIILAWGEGDIETASDER